MNRMHVRGTALAMLLTAAACGDSATDVVSDLSQAEAEALAEVVAGTVVSTFDQQGPVAAPARATFSQQVNFEAPCEYGGTMNVAGELDIVTDDETEELTSLEYTVTQVHSGCVGESQDGLRFTLDGAPNVTANFVAMTEGDLISMDGSYSGGVDWSTDDKDGTCNLSVEFSLEMNAGTETGSASMSGTVCGVTFSRSLTVT
ncbi:MAG: hypothetical protein WD995_09280 [Gemmatimonadota bacterium]